MSDSTTTNHADKLDHVRDLVESNTKDKLTAKLAAIRDDIDAWKDRYEVTG